MGRFRAESEDAWVEREPSQLDEPPQPHAEPQPVRGDGGVGTTRCRTAHAAVDPAQEQDAVTIAERRAPGREFRARVIRLPQPGQAQEGRLQALVGGTAKDVRGGQPGTRQAGGGQIDPAAGRIRPEASTLRAKGWFTAPGTWPATGSMVSFWPA